MTRIFKLAMGSIFLVGSVTPSGAAYYWTGNDLFEECEKESVGCYGYLFGINDIGSIETGIFRSEVALCIPKSVTGKQMRDVVMQRLTSRPQDRNDPAAYIVVASFREAWPC
ncbi:MAG: Rap1a/Tai family immunity protein [Aestuariivirga sp.]